MLILSRKTGENIVIDGRIIVRIMRLEGEVVKVGIDAPIEIPVHRQEVYEEIQKSNREALTDSRTRPPRLDPNHPDKTAFPATGHGGARPGGHRPIPAD